MGLEVTRPVLSTLSLAENDDLFQTFTHLDIPIKHTLPNLSSRDSGDRDKAPSKG